MAPLKTKALKKPDCPFIGGVRAQMRAFNLFFLEIMEPIGHKF